MHRPLLLLASGRSKTNFFPAKNLGDMVRKLGKQEKRPMTRIVNESLELYIGLNYNVGPGGIAVPSEAGQALKRLSILSNVHPVILLREALEKEE